MHGLDVNAVTTASFVYICLIFLLFLNCCFRWAFCRRPIVRPEWEDLSLCNLTSLHRLSWWDRHMILFHAFPFCAPFPSRISFCHVGCIGFILFPSELEMTVTLLCFLGFSKTILICIVLIINFRNLANSLLSGRHLRPCDSPTLWCGGLT